VYMVPMVKGDTKKGGFGQFTGFVVLALYLASKKLDESGFFNYRLRDVYLILYPLRLLYDEKERLAMLVDQLNDESVFFLKFRMDSVLQASDQYVNEEWVKQVSVEKLIIKSDDIIFPKLVEEKISEKILSLGNVSEKDKHILSNFVVLDKDTSGNIRTVFDNWFILKEEYRHQSLFFTRMLNQSERLMKELAKTRITFYNSSEYLAQKERERDLRIQKLVRRKDEMISAVLNSNLNNKEELIQAIEENINDYIEIEKNRFETIKKNWQASNPIFENIINPRHETVDLRRKLEKIMAIFRENSKKIEHAFSELMKYVLRLDEYNFESDIITIYLPYFLVRFQIDSEERTLLVSPLEVDSKNADMILFREQQEFEIFKTSVLHRFQELSESELERKNLLANDDFLKHLKEAVNKIKQITKDPFFDKVGELIDSRIKEIIRIEEYKIVLHRSVMDYINECRAKNLSEGFNISFQGNAKMVFEAIHPHLQSFDSIHQFTNDGPPFSTLATFSSGTEEENKIYLLLHVIGTTIGGKIHIEIAGRNYQLVEKIAEKTKSLIQSVISTAKIIIGNEYIGCPYCNTPAEDAKITKEYMDSEGYVKCARCKTRFQLFKS